MLKFEYEMLREKSYGIEELTSLYNNIETKKNLLLHSAVHCVGIEPELQISSEQ